VARRKVAAPSTTPLPTGPVFFFDIASQNPTNRSGGSSAECPDPLSKNLLRHLFERDC
jgi:hypothetical protein